MLLTTSGRTTVIDVRGLLALTVLVVSSAFLIAGAPQDDFSVRTHQRVSTRIDGRTVATSEHLEDLAWSYCRSRLVDPESCDSIPFRMNDLRGDVQAQVVIERPRSPFARSFEMDRQVLRMNRESQVHVVAHEVAHLRQIEYARELNRQDRTKDGWETVQERSVVAVEKGFGKHQKGSEAVETVAECMAYQWIGLPIVQPYSFYVGRVLEGSEVEPNVACFDTMSEFTGVAQTPV